MPRTSEFTATVRLGADPGSIAGVAVPTNTDIVQGQVVHVIRPGAFAAQMKDPARTPILWNHDPAAPIGRLHALAEADGRVEFAGKITDHPETSKGAEIMALIRDGVLSEVSVGFEWGRWNETQLADGRTRIEHTRARLRELSVVTFGAAGQSATIQTAATHRRPTAGEWRRIVAGLG
jgi:HK97 family phage prohead protease